MSQKRMSLQRATRLPWSFVSRVAMRGRFPTRRHHRSQFPSAVGPMLVCDCQMDAVAMERLARIPIGLSSWRKRKKFGFEEKWRVADTVGNGMYRLNNPGRSKEC